MTVKPGFVDSFWETDFNSTNGFDILCKRLKDGRAMCKTFEDFLKQRAKIEDDYSKALIKLTKSISGVAESGTLRMSWETIKQQTEAIGISHGELSNNLNDQLTKMQHFSDQQKNRRKQVEDDVKKQQLNKQQHHKKSMDAKKQCEAKCKAEEEAVLLFNQSKQSTTTSVKEMEKIQAKKEKCETEAEKADVYYKSCLEALEAVRVEWDISMENACKRFQENEENRIQFMRNEMWVHTNLGSQICVDDDEHYEKMRKVLENCDIEQDIKSFIEEKKTGSDRPAALVYINYRYGATKDRYSPNTPHLNTLSRRPPPPLPADSRPIPPPAGRIRNNLTIDDTDMYACIEEKPSTGDLHKVIKDFPGFSPSELRLQRGNLVVVTGKSPIGGHLVGHLDGDSPSQSGTFPAECISQDIPVSNI